MMQANTFKFASLSIELESFFATYTNGTDTRSKVFFVKSPTFPVSNSGYQVIKIWSLWCPQFSFFHIESRVETSIIIDMNFSVCNSRMIIRRD